MTNPIANPGQFAAAAEVRAMLDLPVTAAARAHAAQLWRVGLPPDVAQDFDAAMDGWVANYLFKAAAMDPYDPRYCYRLAGIRHGCAYRVTGKVDADGGFAITIDDRSVAGRANHMITSPRTKFLFVRDSMMDWERETPLDLAIVRVGGPVSATLSLEERLDEALRRMRADVPLHYSYFRLSAGQAINTMPPPMRTAGVGGLVTQASGIGRLQLAADRAAVIRLDPAGARYASLQLVMWWYRSIDAHRRQSGLTVAQARVDADGWITTVISAQDPGIASWIDAGGIGHLLPMIRWQGLADGPSAPAHMLSVVPLSEVERHMPAETVRIDPAARAVQLAARRAAWERRITP